MKTLWRDKELRAWAKRTGRVGREVIRRVHNNLVSVAAIEIEARVVERTPTFTNTLRSSISRKTYRRGMSAIAEIYSTGTVYAAPVEYGRKPVGSFVPYKALIPWVQRKLGLAGREARTAAFFIARAIARGPQAMGPASRTFRGYHMFHEGFKAAQGKIVAYQRQAKAQITRALARAA